MRTFAPYKSYNFRTKDPVIDQLRTMFQDEFGGVNGLKHKALAAVHEEGGPSTTCMRAWFFGKTRRPTSAAVEAAGRAIGYKREWVKMNGKGGDNAAPAKKR